LVAGHGPAKESTSSNAIQSEEEAGSDEFSAAVIEKR
jgi:hypothetical protein